MTSRQATKSHQHSASTTASNDPPVSAMSDKISDFSNFSENLTQKLKLNNWFHLSSLQNLHIFNVNTKENGNLSIRNTIHINIELVVKVYAENDDIIFTVKLNHWPQLQSLIEQLEHKVKRESEAFALTSFVDETSLSDDVKDHIIDRQYEVVAFDFRAGNDLATDSVDSKQADVSIVKTEPKTNDNLQSQKSYVCTECGKAFSYYSTLILHQRTHEQHSRSKLNETYVRKVDRQMSQQHPDDIQAYECHICHRNYAKLKGLKRHMREKHFPRTKDPSKPVNKTTVTCPICEKKFASKDSLKSHKYRHDKKNWKECLVCNRSYDNLKRHMQNVHSEESKVKNQVCHICGASYKQMSGLTKHMETKHSADGEYFCHICNNGKNYRSKWYLKKHFALVHLYVEQSGKEYTNAFACHLCSERLPSSHTLRQHVRTKHSNDVVETETHYQDEICDKKLGSKKTLHGHLIEHTGRTYVCPECGQPFSHPSHLRAHLNKHDGRETEYKSAKKKVCSMCDKRYVAITDLRLHMVKIHGTILPIKTT
ncbi:hypothetical protein HA402_001962 [Bradysia odoriphaga]|nr:hypothetical protein HA402_001962 [Bradysia odoriphaga]